MRIISWDPDHIKTGWKRRTDEQTAKSSYMRLSASPIYRPGRLQELDRSYLRQSTIECSLSISSKRQLRRTGNEMPEKGNPWPTLSSCCFFGRGHGRAQLLALLRQEGLITVHLLCGGLMRHIIMWETWMRDSFRASQDLRTSEFWICPLYTYAYIKKCVYFILLNMLLAGELHHHASNALKPQLTWYLCSKPLFSVT